MRDDINRNFICHSQWISNVFKRSFIRIFPTGNLDSASSEIVMEYLQMINKDLKKTVVLVTHDAYVASFSNRVIFVKDGKIEVELQKTEEQDAFCDQIMKEQKKILKR